MRKSRVVAVAVAAALIVGAATANAQERRRPFGTLREQATLQQTWLEKRLKTVLPALMRKHGIDMWVIPMREYMEDPTFTSLVSPTTFAARRRTIYVFFDKCAAGGQTDPGGTADDYNAFILKPGFLHESFLERPKNRNLGG